MFNFKNLLASMFLAISVVSTAGAVEPADNGLWSSEFGDLQGFNFVYAPNVVPAVVVFWYTYDEDGNQAWFISETIPVDSNRSEDIAAVFKPICSFLDGGRQCELGDPVGVLAIGRSNDRISVRFGISTALEGFSENCASDVQQPVLPSPLPPDLPSEYACQSHIMLHRISPSIPELSDN